MPDLLPVAPQPGEVEDDDERGEQEPAGDPRDVEARLGETERLERLDVRGRDHRPRVDEDLALGDLDLDRHDRIGGGLARLGGERVAVGGVRHQQRRHDLRREGTLGVGQQGREEPAHVRPGGLHHGIAQLRALERAEHAGCLGRHERPPGSRQPIERRAGGGGDARQRRVERREALLRRQLARERGVDRSEGRRQRIELALGKRRRRVRPEVVLGLHRVTGRLAGGGGLDG